MTLRRLLGGVMLCALCAAAGGGVALWWLGHRPAETAGTETMITQMREVMRLEALDISLHKKVVFAPEPVPADSFWRDVANWAQQSLAPARGKVIVFAVAHVGVELSKLSADSVLLDEGTVFVVLPPLQVSVELLPAETEVIGSNLDTAQTAQLLASAKEAFTRQVQTDPLLTQRARASAQRALQALCTHLGFRDVRFVEVLPTRRPPS